MTESHSPAVSPEVVPGFIPVACLVPTASRQRDKQGRDRDRRRSRGGGFSRCPAGALRRSREEQRPRLSEQRPIQARRALSRGWAGGRPPRSSASHAGPRRGPLAGGRGCDLGYHSHSPFRVKATLGAAPGPCVSALRVGRCLSHFCLEGQFECEDRTLPFSPLRRARAGGQFPSTLSFPRAFVHAHPLRVSADFEP